MHVCACVSGFDPYTPGEVSSVVGYKGAMWSHPSTLVGFAWCGMGSFNWSCTTSVSVSASVCVHLCVYVGGGGGGIDVGLGVGVWVCIGMLVWMCWWV